MGEKLSLSLFITAGISGSVTTVFGKLSSSVDKITQKLSKLNQVSKKIEGYRRLKRELKELQIRMKIGGEESRRASIAWRETAEKLRKLKKELDIAGISVKKLADYEKLLTAQTQRLNRQLEHLAKAEKMAKMRADAFSGWQTLVGAGVALIGPIKAAMDFETAMAEVRKVVDFASKKDLRQFQAELMKLSKVIPLSQAELAEIAAAGGQLGVPRKELGKFIELAAKMAVAFDMSADEAGDAMAKLSNIFHIPIIKMGELGDVINHLSNNTAAKAREIVNVLKRVGGTAKQFGLSAKQTAALADAFIALGRPPEIAGTAINAMLTKLATADRQGKKFQNALAAVGFSAEELKDAIQKDAQGALLKFLKALKAVPKEELAGIITDLFGMEYSDDISLLVGSLDKYEKALKLVGDRASYAGSMQKEFQERANTTANNLQLLRNRINALAINVGSVVLPAVNKVISVIGWGVDKIVGFMEKFPLLTNIVVGALAGIASAVAIFKAGSIGLKFVVGGLGELFYRFRAGIEGARIALLAFRGAELTGQLSGWRLAVYRCTVAVRRFTLSLWQNVKASAAVAASGIRSFLSELPALLGRAAAAARTLSLALLSNPLMLVAAAAAGAAVLIATHWDWVKKKLTATWNAIKAGAGWLWNAFKRFAGIASWFMPVIGPLKLIHALIKKFSHIDLFTAGKNLVISLAKGIWSAVTAPVQAIKRVVQKVRKFLPFSPAKEGPLSTLDRTGPALVKTFAEGISPGEAAKAVKRVSSVVAENLKIKPPVAPDVLGKVRYVAEREKIEGKIEKVKIALSEVKKTYAGSAKSPVNITINFSPRITAGGGTPEEVKEAVSRTLSEERERLRRMLEELIWEERRLSYA